MVGKKVVRSRSVEGPIVFRLLQLQKVKLSVSHIKECVVICFLPFHEKNMFVFFYSAMLIY